MSEDRNIDRLLEELAEIARQQEQGPPVEMEERWQALAAGRLSQEEVRELERGAQGDPAQAALFDAYRPLGEESRSRFYDAARDGLSSKPAVIARGPWTAKLPAARWWVPAAVLAAAASLMLLIVPSPRKAPLPSYRLSLDGAVRLERSDGPASDPEGRSAVALGNRLRLVLIPETAVEGAVEARAFLLQGGRAQPLPGSLTEVSGRGSVRIEGIVGEDLQVPAGDFDLLVAVGRRGELPPSEELVASLEGRFRATGEGWRSWRVGLRRPPPESP